MQTVFLSLFIFSLFFGSGNTVFPLALGVAHPLDTWSAVLGLLLSACALPCCGLIGVYLMRGSLRAFLGPLGKWGSLVMMVLMAALTGPLAAMPRSLIVAYQGFLASGLQLPVVAFSVVFSLTAFGLLWSRSGSLDLIGKVLSPIIIITLAVIILTGTLSLPVAWSSGAVGDGVLEGYNTLDLVAALFFAPSVFVMATKKHDMKQLVTASCIAFVLMSLMYVGMAALGAADQHLGDSPKEGLLVALAISNLGGVGAIMSALTIPLACLTTYVGLSLGIVDLIAEHKPLSPTQERWAHAINLVVATGLAQLGFGPILEFLASVLLFVYPVLVGLTVLVLCRLAWKKLPLQGFAAAGISTMGPEPKDLAD